MAKRSLLRVSEGHGSEAERWPTEWEPGFARRPQAGDDAGTAATARQHPVQRHDTGNPDPRPITKNAEGLSTENNETHQRIVSAEWPARKDSAVTDSGSKKPDGSAPHSAKLSPEAVLEIYTRWQADVRTFLLAITRNADLAEELVQATFSRLVESGETARPASMRGWLFKVAHNELRLLKRRENVHARWLAGTAPRMADEAAPWESLVRGEETDRVRRAMQSLPPDQRQVVEARIRHGKTFAMIAGELGLPLGTVLTRMRLAMAKLHRSLAEDTHNE